MKILVTGGAGFVGSNLVKRLLEDGHVVTVLDNLFTGSEKNLPQHENLSFIHGDVCSPIDLEVDQIYHLACPASPPHYQADSIKTLKTAFIGTLNMLDLAVKRRSRLLFTSTSEIYGDPEVHPQHEEYWGHVNPNGIRSCYDEGKRVGESLVYCYEKKHQLEVRVARIFNTYGPNMSPTDGRVVSNFIVNALQGKDLVIYGDGEQTRSFQYVDDLVEGLIRLMNSNYSQPVNIGNPDEYSINDFAKYIKEFIGNDSKIIHLDPVGDDPRQRKPDISRAKQILGWEPQVSLREGIGKTVEYFQSLLV
jgi:UDP-glucuronate decarboxylase